MSIGSLPCTAPGRSAGGGVDFDRDPGAGDAGDVGVGGVGEGVELQEVAGDGEAENAATQLGHVGAMVHGGTVSCTLDDSAYRLASSMINDSLGAQPDTQLAQSLPQLVREAVTHGRPVAQAPSV
jgi:hypothetical protein